MRKNSSVGVRRTEPDARIVRNHRGRQQRSADREVLPRQLTDGRIGRNFHDVADREQHRERAHIGQLVELLRQEMHLPRRSAGIGQQGGETTERAECDAGRGIGMRGQARESLAEPMAQHEGGGDQSDRQPDVGGRQRRRHQRAERDPHRHAGDHDLQVPGAPVAPIGPDREHVLRQHGRQQDRGRLHRRQQERHQRQRHHAERRRSRPLRGRAGSPPRRRAGRTGDR